MSISVADRFWPKVNKTKDCWLWTAAKNGKGYGRFLHEGKNRFAHRVSWFLSGEVLPKSKILMHSCDNPSCVNPAHLSVGTIQENNLDCKIKGRLADRTDPKRRPCKLTKDDVLNIRSLRETGLSYTEISKRFHVSSRHVSYICKKALWRHI